MPDFPVPQDTVEQGLLASVNQNMARWLDIAGAFDNDDFSSRRDIFLFVGTYLRQYGNLPSLSQISTRFTEWNPPQGDFEYWYSEMKRYSLARRILTAVQAGYERIIDPAQALSQLLNDLSIIRSQETNHIQAMDATAGHRLELFDVRTDGIFNNRQLIGMPTGHKILDETLMGWLPGSLVGAYSRPGVGKTWWLIWQGMHAWMYGGTVLCIAPEMPANMLNLRVDTIAGDHLGHHIDYNKLIIGDPSIRTNYEIITTKLQNSQRWWTYDSLNENKISVGDVAALIRQHNPQEVLIDGVSLLQASRRSQTWEQIKETMYDLKNIATIYDVPILVTHQAVNSNRGRRETEMIPGRGDDFHMPNLNDAAYGDAFVQACSDVITFCAEPSTAHINWYRIVKHRERGFQQPLPVRMGLAVDFRRGIIRDLSDLGYSPEQVGQEARRLLGI